MAVLRNLWLTAAALTAIALTITLTVRRQRDRRPRLVLRRLLVVRHHGRPVRGR